MKKLLISLLAILFGSELLLAQEEAKGEKWNTSYPVQMMEGELFGGLSMPADSYHDAAGRPGFELGAALRYNFKDSPFDVGLRFAFNVVQRRNLHWGEYLTDQSGSMWSLTATGGYNFRQGHKVNPYAELGFGFGRMNVLDNEILPIKGYNFVFSPQIGCEFWGLFRLYASARVIRKGFNSLNIGLAVVFGGWSKK